jgi:uncharacterized protein with HEPN domain
MNREERDADLLRLILELIGLLRRQTSAVDRDSFLADADQLDAAAFRLSHIGEAAKRLSQSLKEKHPQIRWNSMTAMRNVLSHAYGAILPERIWVVLQQELDPLEAACRTELERLGG